MKKAILWNLLEWALRINVSLKLLTYGIGKILGGQFYRKGHIPEDIAAIALGDTGSYNLAWTFFGHSQGYILFIGISQLAGAGLLLFNRTKLIGSAILIPILLNIIVVDYFFGVAYGALFSACFYLASIGFVCFRQKEKLLAAVQLLWVNSEKEGNHQGRWIKIGGLLVFVGLLFLMEYFGIALFGYEDR